MWLPLAQVDVAPLADGLAKSPLAWIASLSLFANAFLLNLLLKEKDKAALNAREDAKAQLGLLGQVLPLATKLVDGVDTLERVTEKLTEGV